MAPKPFKLNRLTHPSAYSFVSSFTYLFGILLKYIKHLIKIAIYIIAFRYKVVSTE